VAYRHGVAVGFRKDHIETNKKFYPSNKTDLSMKCYAHHAHILFVAFRALLNFHHIGNEQELKGNTLLHIKQNSFEQGMGWFTSCTYPDDLKTRYKFYHL
jgi:hypothetical protein